MKKLPFAEKLEEKLELPGEALGRLKLSAWGRERVLLENHGGILCCGPELLAVRWEGGSLLLHGEKLCIEAMDGTDLLLSGHLDRAEWIR